MYFYNILTGGKQEAKVDTKVETKEDDGEWQRNLQHKLSQARLIPPQLQSFTSGLKEKQEVNKKQSNVQFTDDDFFYDDD